MQLLAASVRVGIVKGKVGKRRKAALHGGSERLMSETLEWAKHEADGALVRPRRQGTVLVDRDLRRIECKTGSKTNF